MEASPTFMSRNLRIKSLALTCFLLIASFAAVASGEDAETTARSTGNEEIIVSVTGDYYDRESDITVTITSKNLDPNSEYTLEWELCGGQQYYSTCNLYDSMNMDGQTGDPTETEGTVDIGSGNLFQITTFTFSDPGLLTYTPDPAGQTEGTYDGIYNGTYNFQGILNIQGVPLDTNQSDYIVLGGEVKTQSSYTYLDTNDNVLKNTALSFNGRVWFDADLRDLLDFDLNCELYEDGAATPVDTVSLTGFTTFQDYFNFGHSVNASSPDQFIPTATSGTHHIECSITRLVDNTVMHTIVGNDFEVIDADTTGLEAYNFQTISTVYYDRTTSASQTQLTVSVEFSDLYVGETYTLSWELCGGQQYYSTCNLYDNMNVDAQTGDPTETEGEFSFTTTTSTHTETFTFTDPGLLTYTPDPAGQTEGTYDGIYNGT